MSILLCKRYTLYIKEGKAAVSPSRISSSTVYFSKIIDAKVQLSFAY